MVNKQLAIQMYNEGCTLQRIGDRFNVSRQRINQIVKCLYPTKGHRDYNEKSNPTKSELWVGNKLKEMGFKVEYMPYGNDYDILLNKKIRIEVKYNSHANTMRGKRTYYSATFIFPEFFDFLIFVTGNLEKPISYILSSSSCPTALSVPEHPYFNTYRQRINLENWDMISKTVNYPTRTI